MNMKKPKTNAPGRMKKFARRVRTLHFLWMLVERCGPDKIGDNNAFQDHNALQNTEGAQIV